MIRIPECLEEYINDYRTHIFEIAYLTEEQVKSFQPHIWKLFRSDFGIVEGCFVQKCKNKVYIPSKKTIKHVDAMLKLIL